MKLNTAALKDVELGIPLIAKGLYHARMEKSGKKDWVEANKKGDGNNLVVMFRILDPVVFSYHDPSKEIKNNGQIVNTRYFSLVPTDDYNPDKAMKELAVAIKLPPEQDLNTEDLDQKVVMVAIDYQPKRVDPKTGKEYPEGNVINRITPVPAEDTFTAPPF